MSHDVFSSGEEEYRKLAVTFNAAAVSHAKLLGIPTALVTDNTARLAAFTAACKAADAPNAGRLDLEDHREKRVSLTHNMQKIKKAYLDADPLGAVTPEILLNFGLEKKDTTRTDILDPPEVIPFTLESGGYLKIIVRHPARPAGYNGAVAYLKVGGPPPREHKELTTTRLLTRPVETISCPETQLGETLYITLCWQNEKGRIGPPAPIQSHVIA
jgi:hypothetical protein